MVFMHYQSHFPYINNNTNSFYYKVKYFLNVNCQQLAKASQGGQGSQVFMNKMKSQLLLSAKIFFRYP